MNASRVDSFARDRFKPWVMKSAALGGVGWDATLRLSYDDFGAGVGNGRDNVLRCTGLKDDMVKDGQCGHLKGRSGLNFVHGDERCGAITSRNEGAFEFGICQVERANSKRYGNGAGSEETQIKAQAFGFANRRQSDGPTDFTVDLPSKNNDFEILAIEEGAGDGDRICGDGKSVNG